MDILTCPSSAEKFAQKMQNTEQVTFIILELGIMDDYCIKFRKFRKMKD